MPTHRTVQQLKSFPATSLLAIMAALVIWKITISTLIEYRSYIPPNFQSDFLRGREPHFWGVYCWAFYVHLASGPTSLLLGMFLVSRHVRRAMPKWHRRVGYVQLLNVLLLLSPSGLWMAFYAATGSVAAVGLALLAVATATSVSFGWRAALRRNWASHQLWMWRTFILLCSAVVLRVTGGLATVVGSDAQWLYGLSIWTSWLGPLLIFELSKPFTLPKVVTSLRSKRRHKA